MRQPKEKIQEIADRALMAQREAFSRAFSPTAYVIGQFDFARQCMSDWDSGKLVSCDYCAGYGYVANESEADVVDCPECHGDGYRRG